MTDHNMKDMESSIAAPKGLDKEWRFWTVGGIWHGVRSTGHKVQAGTKAAVRKQAAFCDRWLWD